MLVSYKNVAFYLENSLALCFLSTNLFVNTQFYSYQANEPEHTKLLNLEL